ncbi:hypothetical protein ACLOJK_031544 [Asimina triloba]
MAYRRKQPFSRAKTFTEDFRASPREDSSKPSISRVSTFKGENPTHDDFATSDSSSLAAQAIRASSAHRDSSISSAYGESAYREPNRQRTDSSRQQQDSRTYECISTNSLNESKYGFWGVLARKAKSILEDDTVAQKFEMPGRTRTPVIDTSTGGQEGLTIVETKTADIVSETRKLQIRRKGTNSDSRYQATDSLSPRLPQLQMQTDHETQLKASRDVAMAMAAKAKLLLRELKTVKADLTFTKERCQQLEEENKILRESHEKGDTPEDDDLIRHQLETLLAEKGRLANENSDYARENRFLREIVEYHQLTMQDVVYFDEGIEEVTEVCPIPFIPVSDAHQPSLSPPPPPLQPDTGKTSPSAINSTNDVSNQGKADAVPIPLPHASSPSGASPKSENLKRRQRSPTPTGSA